MKHQVLVSLFLSLLGTYGERLDIPTLFQETPLRTEIAWGVDKFIEGFQYAENLSRDASAIAVNFMNQIHPEHKCVVSSSYVTDHNQVHHVYLRQIIDGKEVINGDFNLNIKDGKVFSFGSSFFDPVERVQVEKTLKLSPMDALKRVAEFAGISNLITGNEVFSAVKRNGIEELTISNVAFCQDEVKIKTNFIQVDNGKALKFGYELVMDMGENWLHSFVDGETGQVLQNIDWVHGATYNFQPFGVNDPLDGERAIVSGLDVDPISSRLGWHNNGRNTVGTTTKGNNVYAQANPTGGSSWENNYRPDGKVGLNFNFPRDLTKQPKEYLDAAITNLFVWNNIMHDVFYHYGFDEKAGNFQDNNFNLGGRENDAVIANCQDGSGTNNANFATPPDGQRGRMRMYIWTQSTPHRDGDFSNDIIIHEYAHGISIRLTGGPANSGCLPGGEAGGMGEGWGDFFGYLFRQKPTYTRNTPIATGNYAMNNSRGVRNFPYSSDRKINNETYKDVKKYGSRVHSIGEVWCMILLEAYWNVVDAFGFDSDWKAGQKGNNAVLRLVVDGMKGQPCRPNFVSARDAIIKADEVNNQGKYSCLLWKGFASRGLGLSATAGGNEAFDVPTPCKNNEFSIREMFNKQ